MPAGSKAKESGNGNGSQSCWSTVVGLLAVVCLFCVPLFIGLAGWDLENDEAIYAYAIDRILETGDWLTPRSIPRDDPFLEKPPLKFWLVAGAIRSGLLTHDEFGLRFIDAVFGSLAFVYVFLLGRALAGAVCGLVAALVLFTLDPLIFEHGLRSNNMEAALVLAFCGGIYHFARWVETESIRHRRRHALAVGVYFALGFMTKFVAIAFLPAVCALGVALRSRGVHRVYSGWRDWIVAFLMVLAATAPWFVYQLVHSGPAVWETMFQAHVVQRFTGTLDMRQLRPFDYYYSQLWRELILAGSHWIALLGGAWLGVKTWTGDPWLARLLFVWAVVPITVISFGTSKLFHYTYPFLPPLALGAGAFAQVLFSAANARAWRALDAIAQRLRQLQSRPESVAAEKAGRIRPLVRMLGALPHRFARIAPVLLAIALCALAVAAWTAINGQIRWQVNGVRLLRNTSVLRPLLIGLILYYLSGYFHRRHVQAALSAGFGFACIAILLPLPAYPDKIDRALSVRRPLRALRDCAISANSSRRPETHVYMPYGELQSHSYYYYLRPVGAWVEHERPRVDDLRSRMSGDQVVLMTNPEFAALDEIRRAPFAFALTDRAWVIVAATGRLESCVVAAISDGGADVRPARSVS